MNILFLCSPVETIKFDEDTTPLMIAEVNRRGHTAWFSTFKDISFVGAEAKINSRRIQLQPGEPYYGFSESESRELESFQIIHQRMDPPFDLNYYFSTLFLETVHRPLVANHPASRRGYNEKLAILLFPDLIAPTLISSDIDQIRTFVKEQKQAVLKPLDSCSGRGVLQLSDGDEDSIAAATEQGRKPVMVQRFLEEIYEGETRLTLLGGEAIGWMKKRPRSGNFLANFDLGATGHPHEPTEAERICAERLKGFMQQNRLYLTAIDIIGGRISEINLTSPGLIRQTNEAMGEKLESQMTDFYEQTYREHKKQVF